MAPRLRPFQSPSRTPQSRKSRLHRLTSVMQGPVPSQILVLDGMDIEGVVHGQAEGLGRRRDVEGSPMSLARGHGQSPELRRIRGREPLGPLEFEEEREGLS